MKILLVCLILVSLFSGCSEADLKQIENIADTTYNYGFVTKVIDGDTFWIDYGSSTEKIRVIGIDTPETYSENTSSKWYGISEAQLDIWGDFATDYAKNTLEGKSVYIETDPLAGPKDSFGRTLAYVRIDGQDYGLLLLERGYARAYTSETFLKVVEYVAAETVARNNRIGVWNN
jgi:micrococcal nuclease